MDCEKYIDLAMNLGPEHGLWRAKHFAEAAKCFERMGALDKAIHYFRKSGDEALSLRPLRTNRRTVAIHSILKVAELSFEVGRDKDFARSIERAGKIIKKTRKVNSSLTEKFNRLAGFKTVSISRNVPARVKEGNIVNVEIELNSKEYDLIDVKISEYVPKDFEVVGGVTEWKGNLAKGKSVKVSCQLKPTSFGSYVFEPTKVSFKAKSLRGDTELLLTGPRAEIKVIPENIEISKLLTSKEVGIGENVWVKTIIKNNSQKDIFEVFVEDEIPEPTDFEYVSPSSWNWKRIKKGESRILSLKLTPKTLGQFKLGRTILKFKDSKGTSFILRSNKVELEVVKETVEYVKCIKCGATMPRDAKFCGVCGNKL